MGTIERLCVSDQGLIVPLATWVDWGIEMGAHLDIVAVVFAKYGVVCECRCVYYFSNFNKGLSAGVCIHGQ